MLPHIVSPGLLRDIKYRPNGIAAISEDIRALKAMSSQTPKSLGNYWETGEVEDHVKIDDGLEKPFYLPLDLCSTPQVD